MTSITVQSPRHIAAPRGAAWAALVFSQATRGLEWLIRTRDVFAADRSLATRIAEANRVRRLARNVAPTDPGFAADLYSAADRHEQAH
jgi:hypothetical protein